MKCILIRYLSPAFLVLFLISCDSNKVFDEYHTISNATWAADSVLQFSFNIPRKTQNHNIFFNIRNDQRYGFSNIWLFVTIQPPSGKVLTDTTQVILAEPSGKWLGKGFSGIYDNRIIYRRNVFFPESGIYTIYIKHGMRLADLKGITDFGIRVEKIN
jgi:gliding motility-associated lipoprotein GldH